MKSTHKQLFINKRKSSKSSELKPEPAKMYQPTHAHAQKKWGEKVQSGKLHPGAGIGKGNYLGVRGVRGRVACVPHNVSTDICSGYKAVYIFLWFFLKHLGH